MLELAEDEYQLYQIASKISEFFNESEKIIESDAKEFFNDLVAKDFLSDFSKC